MRNVIKKYIELKKKKKLSWEFDTYRAHGDGNVKVLGSVVFLEGVDIEPDLITHVHTH